MQKASKHLWFAKHTQLFGKQPSTSSVCFDDGHNNVMCKDKRELLTTATSFDESYNKELWFLITVRHGIKTVTEWLQWTEILKGGEIKRKNCQGVISVIFSSISYFKCLFLVFSILNPKKTEIRHFEGVSERNPTQRWTFLSTQILITPSRLCWMINTWRNPRKCKYHAKGLEGNQCIEWFSPINVLV